MKDAGATMKDAGATMKEETNVVMAVFGVACTALAIAVLAGARDVPWALGAWLGPLLLIGVGAMSLLRLALHRR